MCSIFFNIILNKLLTYLVILVFLASCSTSNEVVSNRLFQKRKYQKGWNVNYSKSYKKDKKIKSDELVTSKETHVKDSNVLVKNETIKEGSTKEQIASLEIDFSKRIKSFQRERKESKRIKIIEGKLINLIHKNQIDDVSYQNSRLSQQKVVDRSDRTIRVVLVLLAIGIILYLQLAPLAVLIALGKVESLITNLIIWLVGVMILSITLYLTFVLAAVFTPTIIVMLILGGAFIIAADLHALYLIFRGY